MGLATVKTSVVAPTLVRNVGHQDDIVPQKLASVALPIGRITAKPTVVLMVMMKIASS
jgi:hypothetical protein